MIIDKKTINKLNEIASKYTTGYINVRDIQVFFAEIKNLGFTIDMIMNNNYKLDYYYNNELVENSLMIFKKYESENSLRNEYTIYFT